MKIYLAGPMSGIEECNAPAFDACVSLLRAEGHEVFNPVEKDREDFGDDFATNGKPTYRHCLKADLSWICDNAEAIALMPGWWNSKGVSAELALANALGLQVTYLVAQEEGGYHWVKV